MAIVRKISAMSINQGVRKPEVVFGGFNKTRVNKSLDIKRNLDNLTGINDIWVL